MPNGLSKTANGKFKSQGQMDKEKFWSALMSYLLVGSCETPRPQGLKGWSHSKARVSTVPGGRANVTCGTKGWLSSEQGQVLFKSFLPSWTESKSFMYSRYDYLNNKHAF